MIIVTGFSNKKVGALKYQQLAFMPNNSIRGAVYGEELREEWVGDTQPAHSHCWHLQMMQVGERCPAQPVKVTPCALASVHASTAELLLLLQKQTVGEAIQVFP